MSGEGKDVNTGDGEDNLMHDADAGIGSSADELETHNPDIDDYDEVIDLLDDDDDDAGGGPENTDDSDSGSSGDDGGEEGGDDDSDSKTVPYERFKEVNDKMRDYEKQLQEKDSAYSRLEGRMEAMERMVVGKDRDEETTEKKPLPLDDVLGAEDQQAILDAFQENPAKFLSDFESRITQANAERAAQERADQEYYSQLHNALDEFGKAHEDFHTNIDKLVGIVEGNPHHNVVSAYYENIMIPALKSELEEKGKDIDAQLAKAKGEGYKEGRKKTIEEIRAKGGARVLDGSTSTGGERVNPEVQELRDVGGDRDKLRDHLTRKLIEKRKKS